MLVAIPSHTTQYSRFSLDAVLCPDIVDRIPESLRRRKQAYVVANQPGEVNAMQERKSSIPSC
jgi:hypothetical protein